MDLAGVDGWRGQLSNLTVKGGESDRRRSSPDFEGKLACCFGDVTRAFRDISRGFPRHFKGSWQFTRLSGVFRTFL